MSICERELLFWMNDRNDAGMEWNPWLLYGYIFKLVWTQET